MLGGVGLDAVVSNYMGLGRFVCPIGGGPRLGVVGSCDRSRVHERWAQTGAGTAGVVALVPLPGPQFVLLGVRGITGWQFSTHSWEFVRFYVLLLGSWCSFSVPSLLCVLLCSRGRGLLGYGGV